VPLSKIFYFSKYIVSWWLVLLVKEIGVTGENHRPVASHQDVSHINLVTCMYVYTVKVLLLVGTNFRGFYKMQ